MSRITLQNTNLDFNVTIVALDENDKEGSSLSIDIGAISNFEIDDNLIDFGITGTITYANWFQIIDKLGIGTTRKKTVMYIIVDIQSNDGADEEERKVSFVGLMNTNSDSGGNIATAKQTYYFEEASTARLKEMTFASLQNVAEKGVRLELIASLLEKSRTPYDKKSFDPPATRDDLRKYPRLPDGSIDWSSLGLTVLGPQASIRDFFKNDDSVYTVINNLYRAVRFESQIPLLKMETVKLMGKDGEECTEERQLQYRNMLSDRHKEFIQEYTTGSNSKLDYSDVYQEEFLIGPEERETLNTSPYNKVEEYRHIKPDLGQLKKNIWGAYKINGHESPDLSNFSSEIISFNVFISDFETIIEHPCNIPLFSDNLDPIEQKIFEEEALSSSRDGTEVVRDMVLNKMFKSFIFRNEAIVLKVKGQLYRKPGVFITIRGSLNTRGKPQTDLWFVIKNKHIFNNGLYENEITAVRFLGDAARVPTNRMLGLQGPPEAAAGRPPEDDIFGLPVPLPPLLSPSESS